jgi:hypothetical protein
MDVERLRQLYDSVAADFERMPALVDEIVDPDIEFVTREDGSEERPPFAPTTKGGCQLAGSHLQKRSALTMSSMLETASSSFS